MRTGVTVSHSRHGRSASSMFCARRLVTWLRSRASSELVSVVMVWVSVGCCKNFKGLLSFRGCDAPVQFLPGSGRANGGFRFLRDRRCAPSASGRSPPHLLSLFLPLPLEAARRNCSLSLLSDPVRVSRRDPVRVSRAHPVRVCHDPVRVGKLRANKMSFGLLFGFHLSPKRCEPVRLLQAPASTSQRCFLTLLCGLLVVRMRLQSGVSGRFLLHSGNALVRDKRRSDWVRIALQFWQLRGSAKKTGLHLLGSQSVVSFSLFRFFWRLWPAALNPDSAGYFWIFWVPDVYFSRGFLCVVIGHSSSIAALGRSQ